eukprot:s2932_g7.t3
MEPEEKTRSVALLMPQLVLDGKADEMVGKLEEAYLEVKARKEVCQGIIEEVYFHYLEPQARQAAVASASRGLCQVLVLEHLEGDVVERALAMKEGLEEVYGKGSFYMSLDKWECQRDMEFFFPHLDSLPVERALAVIKPDAINQGQKEGKTVDQVLEDEAASLGLFVVAKQCPGVALRRQAQAMKLQRCQFLGRWISTRQPGPADELQRVTGLPLNRSNFQKILRILTQSPELISEAFEAQNLKLREGDFTIGISALGRLQLWQNACQLFNRMPHLHVNRGVISCSAAISACERSAQWREAVNFFQAMPDMEIKRDVICYNSIISAYEKGGQWTQALSLFEEMSHVQLKQDTYTYNSSMSACVKGGQWQLALSLFEALPHVQIRPDAFSYSAAISACATSGQWWHAISLLEAMDRRKAMANVVTYNATINACAKGGEWQHALGLLEAMLVAQVAPNAATYSSTISACGPGGHWQPSLTLLNRMTHSQVKQEVYPYNATISACEKAGQWLQALSLFEAMTHLRIPRTVVSYSATISACEKSGQWQLALNLFDQMSHVNVVQDVHSYSATISALEKGAQWEKALSMFERMPGVGIVQDVYCYNATISACEKGGQWQQALFLFEAMPHRQVQRTLISYNTTISACQKTDQWQTALSLFEQMTEVQIVPDNTSYNAILDSTAISSSQLGGHIFQQIGCRSFDVPSYIDLHGLSEGAARLALRWWLSTAVADQLSLVSDSDSWQGIIDLQAAALDFLQAWKLPAEVLLENKGRIRVLLRTQDLPKLRRLGTLFQAERMRLKLNAEQAKLLAKEYEGTADHDGAAAVYTQEGCLAMCFEGRGAIGKMQLIAGPLHSGVARERAPTTIRALWGTDGTSNAIHTSVDMESADKEIKAVFPAGSLKLERTLCLVKPDAINHVVAIKTELEAAGFTVLREKQTTLTEERAKEFYRTLSNEPSFPALVKEAASGPCCAMVLCRLEAVTVLQQLMGDPSVHLARQQRPGSLRARFGRDGQRNALHGSATLKAAVQEIKLFFPDMGVDPLPDDHEVRDFLFRKSARASMDLSTLSDAQTTDFTVDPTFQQLVSNSLIGLCLLAMVGAAGKVKPQGLDAVKWLANWLEENNPNNLSASGMFDPPSRSKQFVEYGVNQDGMPFVVEAPATSEPSKAVVEISDRELQQLKAEAEGDLTTPPFVVFVAGGPGCGKGTQCAKLREEFNLIHLSTGDLMRAEVANSSFLGSEIEKHMANGSLVPDEIVLKLLKKAMVKHQDTNRFLLDGFPRSVEQAQCFERDIAEVSFLLYLEASDDTMKQRIQGRAISQPGRVDDNDETVKKRLDVFHGQTIPLVNYYGPIGKLRRANAEKSPDEVYEECKRFFSCRFLYLLGPPGAPVEQMAGTLEKQYGYSAINLTALLRSYANSNEPDAPAVRKSLAAGKPVDASIACPLILSEIYRDMALGVQNFVLSDFPQSLKQAQFLEYRVSCITKTLVLDFSKADAADLASKGQEKALEAELKGNCFFGAETTSMLETLKAERIPCKLSEMQMGSVVENTWKKLSVKVLPSLTVVLGLPGSGCGTLASVLGTAPNTEAVDCNELLDKELERRTEMGLAMHNMLAKGQVVPLSMTLELLKGVANLTCSENLVIQNCPQYVDQIEIIENEFRIEKVYYIHGSEQAETLWAEEYGKKGESATAAKKFSDLQQRLPPIVAHFARLGKLEKFEVNETPSQEKLQRLLDKSKMPQFAMVNSLSPVLGAQQAKQLAASYGGTMVTMETLMSATGTTEVESSKEVTMLKQYIQGVSSPLVVLQNFPSVDSQAHSFIEAFGSPKVVLDIECDDEFLEEEWKGLHEDDAFDAEQFAEMLAGQRQAREATGKVFKQLCSGSCLSVDKKLLETPGLLKGTVAPKLWPTVYMILAPNGACDFANLVAQTICTSSSVGGLEDAVPVKYTVVDALAICKRGGHEPAVEDALGKASFNANTPDNLPIKVWADLLKEAFMTSANPMGTFLLTNFPTPSSITNNNVRDQLAVVESLSNLAGILHVKVGAAAYACFCSTEPESLTAYEGDDDKVHNQTLAQFGPAYLMECLIQEATDGPLAAQKVAGHFFKELSGREGRSNE